MTTKRKEDNSVWEEAEGQRDPGVECMSPMHTPVRREKTSGERKQNDETMDTEGEKWRNEWKEMGNSEQRRERMRGNHHRVANESRGERNNKREAS